jgi:hypothetical protein
MLHSPYEMKRSNDQWVIGPAEPADEEMMTDSEGYT